MYKTTFYVMENICDWYHTKEHNYLRIYCRYEPPNIFPLYVIENIVLLEIAYQDYVNKVGSILENSNKSTCPPLPLIVGSYVIEFSRKMEKEFPSLKNIHVGKKLFKRQDPELVVYIHFQLLIFFLILMKAM